MRRKLKSKRVLAPDHKYDSVKVAKLINYVMEKGHKHIARAIVYGAMDEIAKVTKKEPIEVLEQAITNTAPLMEIKTRRVGGANYQIPHEVGDERKLTLTYRWFLEFCRGRQGKPMKLKLAEEIMAAAKGEGESIKRRENVHRMAEANRAFAHFARRPNTPSANSAR